MGFAGIERFKIFRRNSLRNEVDGSFDDLEEFEDRNEPSSTNWVTHQECMLLNRVLSDKAKLPPACFVPPTAVAREVSSKGPKAPTPAQNDETVMGDLVRRITGAVQPVLSSLVTQHPPKKEMGGTITEEECQTLAQYLSPSVGGQYLLPTTCSSLNNAANEDLAKVYEKENAAVYARLKRRNTVMAKEGFPPTMC